MKNSTKRLKMRKYSILKTCHTNINLFSRHLRVAHWCSWAWFLPAHRVLGPDHCPLSVASSRQGRLEVWEPPDPQPPPSAPLRGGGRGTVETHGGQIVPSLPGAADRPALPPQCPFTWEWQPPAVAQPASRGVDLSPRSPGSTPACRPLPAPHGEACVPAARSSARSSRQPTHPRGVDARERLRYPLFGVCSDEGPFAGQCRGGFYFCPECGELLSLRMR